MPSTWPILGEHHWYSFGENLWYIFARKVTAPNLLQRDFSADAPNEKGVGDSVGIWTDEGWLYLAALLDTYSRLIVGWAMSIYRDEALVEAALRMALARRELPEDSDLIQHTDRGSQYTADNYLELLKAHGIQHER